MGRRYTSAGLRKKKKKAAFNPFPTLTIPEAPAGSGETIQPGTLPEGRMTTELKTKTRKALSKLRLTKLARSSVKVSEEKGGMGGGDCIGPGKPHSRSGGEVGTQS